MALADKLDTLRGCFGVGLIPTGSRDPFALRRAAQGVVKILVEGKLRHCRCSTCSATTTQLQAFFADRVRYYFRDVRGFEYDEVNACMAASVGWGNLVDLEARLERVRGLRASPDFEPLAASFKRIANILEQAKDKGFTPGPSGIDEALLEAGPERELYEEFRAHRRPARSKTLISRRCGPRSTCSSTRCW